MSEFFGISMTYIMIALLCVLFVAIASVGYVFLRNRVMFLVGVRNIPRRRAQTPTSANRLSTVAVPPLTPVVPAPTQALSLIHI